MNPRDVADHRPGRQERLDARPVRLAVVDHVEIVVAGVTAMLGPYDGRVRVVEVAAGGRDQGQVDVVLYGTDTQTAGTRDSLQVLLGRTLGVADRSPGQRAPRVVVFSWNIDPARVDAALRRGAAGYLSKGLTAVDLVNAVEQVHAGARVRPEVEGTRAGPVGDRPVGDGLVGDWPVEDWPVEDWPGRLQGLSLRESETLALITQGLSNLQIAEQSFLSVNSVKTHIRSAYRKIGVARRSQAVLWGLQHGFDVPVRPATGSEPVGTDLTRRPPPASRSRPPAAGR